MSNPQADPARRWTIAQVAVNPWFNRRILTPEAVVAEMQAQFIAMKERKQAVKLREHHHDALLGGPGRLAR